MKLTLEENPEAIRRYAHIKPAPRWGSVPCSARCPGTVRTCTLKKGHTGLHVAHGMFRKVLAVWDRGALVRDSVERPADPPRIVPTRPRRARQVTPPEGTQWRSLIPSPHTIEAAFLLLLVLAMIGFAVDWALRILGVR